MSDATEGAEMGTGWCSRRDNGSRPGQQARRSWPWRRRCPPWPRMQPAGRCRWAQTAAATFRFAIPAKPLPQAIADLSALTGVQVLYTAERPFSVTAQPVQGTYTAAEALGLMLRGTGLGYRFVRAGAVTLEPLPAAVTGAVSLPGVTVEGRDAGTCPYPPGIDRHQDRHADHEIPASVQVVPRALIDDQQALRVDEALHNMRGTVYINSSEGGSLSGPSCWARDGRGRHSRGTSTAPAMAKGMSGVGGPAIPKCGWTLLCHPRGTRHGLRRARCSRCRQDMRSGELRDRPGNGP